MQRSRSSRVLAWIGVLAALTLAGFSAASGVGAQETVDTPCGEAPPGYNVIVSGAAVITGTDGPDFICGGHQANHISGLGGDDIIVARSGDDVVEGGRGDDVIYAGGGNDTVRGGRGNDQIHGELGVDYLYGDLGNDWMNGGRRNDRMYGGDGHDILIGRDGKDKMYGEAGNDRMKGGVGNDTMRGGDGNDNLRGDNGHDQISGDDGHDFIHGRGGQFDACIRAARYRGCESYEFSDATFTVRANRYVEGGWEFRKEYEAFDTLTIRVWGTPARQILLYENTAVADKNGRFEHEIPFEVRDDGVVEVIEPSGALRAARLDAVTIDTVELDGVVSGTAEPNAPITVELDATFAIGEPTTRTTTADAEGNWTVDYGGWSPVLSTITAYVRVYTTMSPEPVGRTTVAVERWAPRPTRKLFVSNFEVAGLDGPWTPGETVEIRVNGQLVTSSVVTDDGGFYYGSDPDTPIVADGDEVSVQEVGTGATKTLIYRLGFEGLFITEHGDLVAVGTALPLRRVYVALVDDTGAVHRRDVQASQFNNWQIGPFPQNVQYVRGWLTYEHGQGHIIRRYL